LQAIIIAIFKEEQTYICKTDDHKENNIAYIAISFSHSSISSCTT